MRTQTKPPWRPTVKERWKRVERLFAHWQGLTFGAETLLHTRFHGLCEGATGLTSYRQAIAVASLSRIRYFTALTNCFLQRWNRVQGIEAVLFFVSVYSEGSSSNNNISNGATTYVVECVSTSRSDGNLWERMADVRGFSR